MTYLIREDKWTKAREDCPHPEYWHAPDADTTEHEVSDLVGGFVRALQPDYAIETGSAFGYTSEMIGQALNRNQHGLLISLEVNAQRAQVARQRCKNLPVEIVEESSMAWAIPQEMVGRIGFLWLDSLHDLRVKELIRFYPYLAPKAIVGVHDTGPHHTYKLGSELEDYLHASKLGRPIYLPTPRGVTFIEMTDPANDPRIHE